MTVFRAPTAIVLMYHRIVDNGRDPFWLHVSPDQFTAHLEVVTASCDVVPFARIRESFRGRRRVAITFDDGYQDNLETAAPALESFGVPATVFVVSDLLDGTRSFWWDRLEHLLLDGPDRPPVDLDVDGRTVTLQLDGRQSRERCLQHLAARLRPLTDAERERVLDQLATSIGTEAGHCRCHAHLSGPQIVELSQRPGIEIGAHTRSHACLRTLGRSAQIAEVAGSRRALEAAVGVPVTTFAYPYGSHDSWDRSSVGAARAAGITLAATTITGDVTAATDRLRIPRVAVRGWAGESFAEHLEHWFRGGRSE